VPTHPQPSVTQEQRGELTEGAVDPDRP